MNGLSSLAALMTVLRTRPEDDAPRLIAADWFEEHGQPERAEFIRCQCERARLLPDSPRSIQLRRRIQHLLSQHEAAWLAPLRPIAGVEYEYQRGFIEEVRVGPNASAVAIRNWREALPEVPLLRLSIRDDKLFVDALADLSAALVGLTHLHLDDVMDYPVRALRRLLLVPYRASLRSLRLHTHCEGTALRDDILRDIVTSPILSRLEELDLQQPGIAGLSGPVIRAIAQSPAMKHLRRLNLAGAEMDRATAEALARSRYLTRLEELDLADCQMDRAGWQVLVGSPNLAGLRWLRLRDANWPLPILLAFRARLSEDVLEV